jgi:DNA-binding CsgD family transcriptional regulator/tetratricopeptide (TPR) repeat protein
LLERELEVAEARAGIEEARKGRGQLLVVQAAAGLGKTSLLAAACRTARTHGMRVLTARGSELESSFPFGVVRQLFESVLHGVSDEVRCRWLTGAAGLAKPMFDNSAPIEALDAADATYARLHGLYWLCCNMAHEQPLLLSIDDAHWSDDPSLKFLSFLSRRLEDVAVLLLVAARPNEEALSAQLPTLVADPGARNLKLAPLSDRAVRDWVRSVLGSGADEEFCRACHGATNGNPLLIAELIREVSAEHVAPTAQHAARVEALGSHGVSSVVLLRLARLSAEARELARAVAVLGDTANLSLAGALAGLDKAAAASAAAALLRAEILIGDDGLSFVHPIVREAVYQNISSVDRPDHHARAARLLAKRRCSPQVTAAQLLQTAPAGEEWAVDVLREAAVLALSLGDSKVAVIYLTRALAEPPSDAGRAAVLAELGRAEARTGAPAAVEHLEQAIALAPDPCEAAVAASELAGLLKFAGESVRAVDVLKKAQGRLSEDDSELFDRLEVELIGCAYISVSARRMLADKLARLDDCGGAPETFLERFMLAGMALDAFVEGQHRDRVIELATRALAGGDLPTDPVSGGHAFLNAAIGLMFAERYEQAERLYSIALDEARKRGSGVSFATAASLRSLVYYRRGRLPDAEADARAALNLASEVHGSQGFLSAALGTLIYTSLDRGTADAELERFADAFLIEQATDTLPYSHAIHSRACLRVWAGDLHGGLEQLLIAGRRELEWGAPNPAITPWRSSAALVLARLGDVTEARRLASEEVSLARAFGAPRCLGVALRAAGLVEENSMRVGLLREAVGVLEGSCGVLELTRSLIDLGAALRLAGSPAEARVLLGRGQELAAFCAATALVKRARDELRTAGARPRRVAVSGVHALTPSERRVAQMAADGLINREIAQSLFVTEKTVETHLRNAYAKLKVRSRTQLQGAFTASLTTSSARITELRRATA